MKKAIALFIGGVILMVILLQVLISNVGKEISEASKKYEEKIGDNYVMKSDTLLITDYSLIKDTFTLSNGKEINSKLVFKK